MSGENKKILDYVGDDGELIVPITEYILPVQSVDMPKEKRKNRSLLYETLSITNEQSGPNFTLVAYRIAKPVTNRMNRPQGKSTKVDVFIYWVFWGFVLVVAVGWLILLGAIFIP